MKFTAAAAVLASFAPSLALALVGNSWKFLTAPTEGLNDVTFAFNMAHAPHKSGFFFAQQFSFKNEPNKVGYTGLLPGTDLNGNNVVHAAFSSFVPGTTTVHPKCKNGADGGAGVSCGIQVKGDYDHTYKVTVENTAGTTWRGTLIDTVTGTTNVIGEWTLPNGAGKMNSGQLGFVEYFPWNVQHGHTCESLPLSEVSIFNPTSKTQGVNGGSITSVYEYGNCIGKAGYSLTKVAGGYDIKVGF